MRHFPAKTRQSVRTIYWPDINHTMCSDVPSIVKRKTANIHIIKLIVILWAILYGFHLFTFGQARSYHAIMFFNFYHVVTTLVILLIPRVRFELLLPFRT